MKEIIQSILKILSKLILTKYQPDVIGITGSVGKTSTKMAVQIVLQKDFRVRASQKSYNTETGVPLTVIGSTNPGRNILGWLGVILKALSLIIWQDKSYPNILILEMAADHPGDIEYLVKFAKPKIGVITSIGPTHLEFFKSVKNVALEKEKMITHLDEKSFAILNNDDPLVAKLRNKTRANILTYGLKENSMLQASQIYIDNEKADLNFKLTYEDTSVPVNLVNVLGKPTLYSILVAAAVGLIHGLSLEEISARLKDYQPLPGRLNLLPGIKHTQIIDDSYNSSPLAAQAALEILVHLKCSGDKFAVLGDMLELGAKTEKLHQEVGQQVASLGIDYLIAVGECSTDTAIAAVEYGMNEDRVFTFDNSTNAGRFIQDRIQQGDLILVKGSRGIKTEKIVKEIMAEPQRAGEVLVGQGER